ncbi:hypothetical protein [Sneathiella glossodoripedis]|uniref:hypothetical protein n=1 Tax=Sneathiella glossodoripedis TaxID=418853 RepID=UPI00047077BD|nr:hypothetical protein [Sneathiella glossodoripedis]
MPTNFIDLCPIGYRVCEAKLNFDGYTLAIEIETFSKNKETVCKRFEFPKVQKFEFSQTHALGSFELYKLNQIEERKAENKIDYLYIGYCEDFGAFIVTSSKINIASTIAN